ncbi:hypothetical protein BRC97_09165 [Halobacteriales archaeon QS_6_71_20]|nr:MAG: hypothetical protein BRC97_09165 [Halobacteriales archaeon QS_6_71_20]
MDFPRRQAVSARGGPSSGKSALSVQFLDAGVTVGEDCLYVTIEQTLDDVRDPFGAFPFALDDGRLDVIGFHILPGATLKSPDGDSRTLTLQRLDAAAVERAPIASPRGQLLSPPTAYRRRVPSRPPPRRNRRPPPRGGPRRRRPAVRPRREGGAAPVVGRVRPPARPVRRRRRRVERPDCGRPDGAHDGDGGRPVDRVTGRRRQPARVSATD